jgi:hypothetical protein
MTTSATKPALAAELLLLSRRELTRVLAWQKNLRCTAAVPRVDRNSLLEVLEVQFVEISLLNPSSHNYFRSLDTQSAAGNDISVANSAFKVPSTTKSE